MFTEITGKVAQCNLGRTSHSRHINCTIFNIKYVINITVPKVTLCHQAL